AAAVWRGAAVGVDDDLAAGHAGIAVRPADDEAPGRVDVNLGLGVAHLFGDDAVDDLLGDVFPHRFVGDERAVLAGDDDGIDANRRGAVIFDGDLGLAVG